MNSHQLKADVAEDLRHLEHDLARDARAEFQHVTDPSQCGVVVRNHVNGLLLTLYVFIFLFLTAALWAIYAYMHP